MICSWVPPFYQTQSSNHNKNSFFLLSEYDFFLLPPLCIFLVFLKTFSEIIFSLAMFMSNSEQKFFFSPRVNYVLANCAHCSICFDRIIAENVNNFSLNYRFKMMFLPFCSSFYPLVMHDHPMQVLGSPGMTVFVLNGCIILRYLYWPQNIHFGSVLLHKIIVCLWTAWIQPSH